MSFAAPLKKNETGLASIVRRTRVRRRGKKLGLATHSRWGFSTLDRTVETHPSRANRTYSGVGLLFSCTSIATRRVYEQHKQTKSASCSPAQSSVPSSTTQVCCWLAFVQAAVAAAAGLWCRFHYWCGASCLSGMKSAVPSVQMHQIPTISPADRNRLLSTSLL
jgi:hypothetical protein